MRRLLHERRLVVTRATIARSSADRARQPESSLPSSSVAMASFPTVQSNQHTSSMGTSSRFGVPKSARFTPGPGAYVGSEITGSQYASSPSAPWIPRTATPGLRKSTSSEYMGQGSTFGAQSTSVRASTPRSSFGTAHRLLREDKVPGPGAYGFSSSFARSAEKRDGIGSSFGGSQDLGRLATWASLSPEEQTPGPHQAGPDSCGGGHVESTWRNAPSVSFLGNSCERKITLNPSGQAGGWRSQGIMGRCAAAMLALRLTHPLTARPLYAAPSPALLYPAHPAPTSTSQPHPHPHLSASPPSPPPILQPCPPVRASCAGYR